MLKCINHYSEKLRSACDKQVIKEFMQKLKKEHHLEFCPDHPKNLVSQHLQQTQEMMDSSDEDYDEEEDCDEFANPGYVSNDDDDDEGFVLTYCQCPCPCCTYVYDKTSGGTILVMKTS